MQLSERNWDNMENLKNEIKWSYEKVEMNEINVCDDYDEYYSHSVSVVINYHYQNFNFNWQTDRSIVLSFYRAMLR